MGLARVFPRKTSASPDDAFAFFGSPTIDHSAFITEVHVSCAWTEDKAKAESLAEEWERIAPVKLGGPAYDDPGGEFAPGMYVKRGYTITSRGCPNNCWFCLVPRREGGIRELEVKDGWNVLDSNILACSDEHFSKVIDMLGRQERRAEFTGGFEAARLRRYHVNKLWYLRPAQMFFAYDTPDDLEPLINAGKELRIADFTRRHLQCYVLIGYPNDSMDNAERRFLQAWDAGFMPRAMLWRGPNNEEPPKDWKQFQRLWARPAITRKMVRDWYVQTASIESFGLLK